MQACDRCHARKTRCDRRMPQCSACQKAGAACLHVDKVRQRQIPRGHIDNMERRLQELSDENQTLRRELAALRSQQDDSGTKNNNTVASSEVSNDQTHVNDTVDAAGYEYLSPGQTPAGDIFTTEVSYLSLKATGETRFVGSSSGMGLANIIDSLFNSRSGIPLLPPHPKETDGRNDGIAQPTSHDLAFPPLSAAAPFIEAYFQHNHISFPLLHRPSFHKITEQIYNEPGYYESHPYESFIFDMVLAIGCSNFNRFEESTAGTTTHYARARAKLHQILGMKGLMPLRAIILLSQHGIFSNLRDTSASIWHLVGIGVRICFEMGLHLESKRPRGQSSQHSQAVRQVTMEEEMNKRCFWCLYNLDRVVSFTLGRPAALQDRDIEVSLPSHLDDDSFSVDRPIIRESEPESGAHISPFLHLIRIRRLSGEILTTLYSAKQGANDSPKEKALVRRRLHEKLVSWRNDTRLLKLAEKQFDEGAYVSSFLTPEWYDAVFNNAMLLLYRPSPYLPHPITTTALGNEGGDQDNLFQAAKAAINAYSEIHRKRRLNYSWITLHGVFIAGLAYVYAVGRALNSPGQILAIPDYLDIINDTRTCSNLLVAICERWNVARRSCELFNKLSSAVIRDSVMAATRRETGRTPVSNVSCHPRGDGQQQALSNAGSVAGQTVGLQQDGFWNDIGYSNQPPPEDHRSVIDEFRYYANAFESNTFGEQTFPSELVAGFAQGWTFDDPFSNGEDGGVQIQGNNNFWFQNF